MFLTLRVCGRPNLSSQEVKLTQGIYVLFVGEAQTREQSQQ